MKNPGVYERHRDDMRAAECWRTDNVTCLAHFHASIEIVYVLSGGFTAILDGQSMPVRQGQYLIADSYSVHAYTQEGACGAVLCIIPQGSVPSLQAQLKSCAFASPLYDAKDDSALLALPALMADCFADCGYETRKGFAYALLGLLIARVGLSSAHEASRSDVMRDVLSYLQSHYQQQVRLAELAARFGYSKSRFSHLFNETLGCSLSAHLGALRCRHAAELLLSGETPLLEISMSAGFDCPRTFYRTFRRFYGTSPSKYRERARA